MSNKRSLTTVFTDQETPRGQGEQVTAEGAGDSTLEGERTTLNVGDGTSSGEHGTSTVEDKTVEVAPETTDDTHAPSDVLSRFKARQAEATKKEPTFSEKYSRELFFVEKGLAKRLEKVVERYRKHDKGFKTKFINDALEVAVAAFEAEIEKEKKQGRAKG